MKKVFILFALMLFFACNNDDFKSYQVAAVYVVKNTSNQTIIFDVTPVEGMAMPGTLSTTVENGGYRYALDANDSIAFMSLSTWEDMDNHPNWFTKFDINPVDDIQMNDPYLPENWEEHHFTVPADWGYYGGDYKSASTYLFTLNNETNDVPFKYCTCEDVPDFKPTLLDEQYTKKIVYFFKDSSPIPSDIAEVLHSVDYMVYISESDETRLFINSNHQWELPGFAKVCNLPNWAKDWLSFENGVQVYIEGSIYEMSCWGAIGTVYSFDYVLTAFKGVGQLGE